MAFAFIIIIFLIFEIENLTECEAKVHFNINFYHYYCKNMFKITSKNIQIISPTYLNFHFVQNIF